MRRKIGCIDEKISNDETRLLSSIAKELYKLGKITSYRDFSRKFLEKNSNYMNVLFGNIQLKPSIPAIIRLYQNLREEGCLTYILEHLQNHIFNRISNQYKRKGTFLWLEQETNN